MLRQLLLLLVRNIDGLIPFTFGALMALQGSGKIRFSRDPERNARLLSQHGPRNQRIGAAAMAIGILFMVLGAAAPDHEPTGPEVAQKIADGARIKLPIKLDELTTLEDVSASDAVLTYRLRIPKHSHQELAPDDAAFRASALASVCSNIDLVRLLGMGIRIAYVYLSADSVVVADFSLTSQDCAGLPNPASAADVTRRFAPGAAADPQGR
jgi:hypothetical protein